jgi:hemophore-related protein
MITLSLSRLAASVAGLAISLTTGAGIASADPDIGPVVDTTCSYSQVVAALNAQDPAAAAQLNTSPMAQSYLRRFLASPPDQRQRMVQNVQGIPEAQQYFGTIQQVANVCNNY